MGKFFISRPIFAIAIAIAIVIIGTVSLLNLSVEQYPNITPPVVQVTATYDGADAETVNNSVATPIGQSVMGVSDLLYMQTTSANDGSMTLQAVFDIGSNADIDAILTQNRVSWASASLPESVIEQGITTQKTMPAFMMVYALHSPRYDATFLTNYAIINIQNELLKINGVGQVQIMGAGEYSMRIWIDPEKLGYYNISIDDITSAITSQGGIYPAGSLGAAPSPDGTTFKYTVILPPQLTSAEEFGQIILRSSSEGDIVRLKDIASVNLGADSYEINSLYGDEAAAMIIIYQAPGSNAVELGDKISATLEKLSSRLPDSIECSLVVDSTKSIKAGISDIIKTLIIALALVIFIIFIFLQDWRATIITLIAIPVSLLGAFIVFPLLGFTINIISLLGLVLAIGLVVDDAIVVVEAVQLNIQRGMSPDKAAEEAMRNVSSPIIATTVVLLAVFIPVSFMASVTGLLFQQFAIVLAVSVLFSAINALTLSPALCAMLLKPHDEPKSGFFYLFNRSFDEAMKRYSRSVGYLISRPVRVAIITAAVIAALALAWRKLPQGFLPVEDQGYLMVMVEAPENSALKTTLEAMKHVGEIIESNKSVASISYAAGYDMLASIASSNNGIFFVMLKDYSERKLTADQIAQELNGELYVAVPEVLSYAFIPPAIPGLGLDSGVTFQVQDLEGRGGDYLWEQTKQLITLLKENDMVAGVSTQYSDGIAQRLLKIDMEHAENLGISPNRLYTTIGALLGSSYINNFNRFGQLYQTYIEAAPEFRSDESVLESIFIESASGESVPLASIARFEPTSGVKYVSQYNLYRSIGLTVSPAHGFSSSQVMSLIEQLELKSMPEDIGIAWSGMSLQQSESSKSGGVVYILAVIFVFLALASLYNSWSLPLSVLLAVPVAVLGALGLVYCIHQVDPLMVNDIYMQITLVMLIGLAAKNSILVVEYAERNNIEKRMPLLEAAVDAAKLRARPIIMTAFAFILGVIPLVFASGVYATARNVMGISLVGGMLLATLLGLFLYPALYYMVTYFTKTKKER
ncbi:MAG: efflux RND transporter permease subunit [Rikenellaceae bacterium]